MYQSFYQRKFLGTPYPPAPARPAPPKLSGAPAGAPIHAPILRYRRAQPPQAAAPCISLVKAMRSLLGRSSLTLAVHRSQWRWRVSVRRRAPCPWSLCERISNCEIQVRPPRRAASNTSPSTGLAPNLFSSMFFKFWSRVPQLNLIKNTLVRCGEARTVDRLGALGYVLKYRRSL